MPVVFRERGFRFFFYSNEGAPCDPVHIYIEKDNLEAKFWLRPHVRVATMKAATPIPCANYWRSSKVIATTSKGHGMSSSVSATRVHFDSDSMWVHLGDGRVLGVPLAWFPRLAHATPEQREQVRIGGRGLHCEALDEDISIAGLLAGLGDHWSSPSTPNLGRHLRPKSADLHLMVDFHGSNKPTGMDRTWPNVITREAVRGHEYQITRYHRVPAADHDVILPFTRYLAGPGDYTPTVFTTSELMGNTWAHELAQAVVFTSPFLCFGGHPQSYLENPARDVITAIAPVWDETRVLPGSEPGKVVAEARRSGKQWFIAVINGGEATTLEIPLNFLGTGPWKYTQLRDAKEKPDAWNRQDGKTTRNGRIRLEIAARGGFVGWIRQ